MIVGSNRPAVAWCRSAAHDSARSIDALTSVHAPAPRLSRLSSLSARKRLQHCSRRSSSVTAHSMTPAGVSAQMMCASLPIAGRTRSDQYAPPAPVSVRSGAGGGAVPFVDTGSAAPAALARRRRRGRRRGRWDEHGGRRRRRGSLGRRRDRNRRRCCVRGRRRGRGRGGGRSHGDRRRGCSGRRRK